MNSILDHYKNSAPAWATHLTADAHGYVRAWDCLPTVTPGGLYFSTGRSEVLQKPGFTPEILPLLSEPAAADPLA